jgi:hypothetical protein
MAHAADRVAGRKEKREREHSAAVGWLELKRGEMGITALATMLGVDAPNLGKMIDGKRTPSPALRARIQSLQLEMAAGLGGQSSEI